jgi:hypothetical protein
MTAKLIKAAMKALAALFFALMISIPYSVRAEQPFSVEKRCNISKAPKEFELDRNFFKLFHPDYVTPYDIYHNTEKTKVLISNMKDNCWVEVISNNGPWKATPITPAGGGIDFEKSRSRSLAQTMFESLVASCPDVECSFIKDYYFYDEFKREFKTIMEKIEDCNDCPGEEYYVIAYSTVAIRLDQADKTIVVDIVAGTSVVGVVQ